MDVLAYAKVGARITIDDATGLRTVEVRRTNDEIGDVEGQEAVAVETARVSPLGGRKANRTIYRLPHESHLSASLQYHYVCL